MKLKELNLTEIREIAKKPVADIQKLPVTIENVLAACCKATENALGISPFDEQLIAAFRLYEPAIHEKQNKNNYGSVIDMPTGEGKTFAAVYAAALIIYLRRKLPDEQNIFDGVNETPLKWQKGQNDSDGEDEQNVHLLTFNDYLAERDYNWTKSIYKELGIPVGLITEKTPREERKAIYQSCAVYASAKEVGFDWLREFVAGKQSDILDLKLNAAICDEADSLLIDEGNVPLVIAGEFKSADNSGLLDLCEFVSAFTEEDYGFSDDNKGVFLTDEGITKIENHLNIENLFDSENEKALSDVNNLLEACFLFKENKDFIIRDGKIKIIDAFTGRVAENRSYRAPLQASIQITHGLPVTPYTRVIGNTPIQFFIRQYEFLAGMTGTAESSEEEFELLYGLKLVKIPPRLPSKRIDYPTLVYFNKEIKVDNIINEILKRHKTGQPVLFGADSIDDAELFGEELLKRGISDVKVLTAKNDYLESEIIKNAGKLNAVTVSANMSGRGVDIILGGVEKENSDKIKELGGLCVISQSLRESARLNAQLSGRAGRQGDPGESLIFAALDDSIMVTHKLNKLINKKYFRNYTAERIETPDVMREVARIQRISEGELLEERKRLLKFTTITEKHRDIIFTREKHFALDYEKCEIWEDNEKLFSTALSKFGKIKVDFVQKQCAVAALCEIWTKYLEFTSDLKAGIHLTSVGGKVPHDEFNFECEQYFSGIEDEFKEIMSRYLTRLAAIDDIKNFKIRRPKNVKTYLLSETADELVKYSIATWFYSDEAPQIIGTAKKEDTVTENNTPIPKKGFFSKIFGK